MANGLSRFYNTILSFLNSLQKVVYSSHLQENSYYLSIEQKSYVREFSLIFQSKAITDQNNNKQFPTISSRSFQDDLKIEQNNDVKIHIETFILLIFLSSKFVLSVKEFNY